MFEYIKESPEKIPGGYIVMSAGTDIIALINELSSKKFKDDAKYSGIYSKILKDIYENQSVIELIENIQSYCGKYAITFICNEGHRIAKAIYCQSEFCEICGQENSKAHKRRVARILNYVLSFDSIGYFVFTLPVEVRIKFLNNKKIKIKIQRGIKNILKKYNIELYVGRWHWFGDPPKKKNVKMKFNPHLNILANSSRLSKEDIDNIRLEYTNLINKIFDTNYKNCDFQYQFYDVVRENLNTTESKKKINKIYHKIFYVFRPTIRTYLDNSNEVDSDLIMKLYVYLFRSKNTFIVNSKRFDLLKGYETAKAYSVLFEMSKERSEQEIMKIYQSNEIERCLKRDKCICGQDIILKRIEMITDKERETADDTGFIMLENITNKELNKIKHILRIEALRCCDAYLDNVAITNRIVSENNKNKKFYIQQRLKL
jgi:hypothetical protein